MNTRSQVIRGGLVVALIIGLSVPAVGAFAKTKSRSAKKAKSAGITLVGTAEVVTGKRGKLTALSLRDAEGTSHRVMLNSAAKKVAKKMAGKTVAVTGVLVHRKTKAGKVTWLRVKSFKAAAAPPAPVQPERDDDGEDDGDDDQDE